MFTRLLPFSCLFLLFSAVAQDTPPLAPANQAASKAMRAPVVVTLAFPGGTLGEFVVQIRKVEPKANIIVATGAASARLPAIDLRGAGLDQALEGACAVAQSELLIRMKEFGGPGEPVYTIMANEPGGTTRTTGGPSGPGSPASPAPARREGTQVHSLNRLLETKDAAGFSVATVLSAIDAAIGTEQPLASLGFHKESGLLIVRGTVEQVAIVREVLVTLERDLDERRQPNHGKKDNRAEPPKEQPK